VNIFCSKVAIHPGRKDAKVYSFGKSPHEFGDEIMKRRKPSTLTKATPEELEKLGLPSSDPFKSVEELQNFVILRRFKTPALMTCSKLQFYAYYVKTK